MTRHILAAPSHLVLLVLVFLHHFTQEASAWNLNRPGCPSPPSPSTRDGWSLPNLGYFPSAKSGIGRGSFLSTASTGAAAIAGLVGGADPALAFSPAESSASAASTMSPAQSSAVSPKKVAYRSLSLDFGPEVQVPVAMWHPLAASPAPDESSPIAAIPAANAATPPLTPAVYQHRISVQKIGQLLAGWDFLPSFAAKNFALSPTAPNAVVLATAATPLPESGPLVLLAHGYLGSRFDLSHLAEALAAEGFVVVSAEYPESLASSYPRTDGVDRAAITNKLLEELPVWGVQPTRYGIVGHSLGTGTVINTGDDTWARVCIAGMPAPGRGAALFVGSENDGAVGLGRVRGSLGDYELLSEEEAREVGSSINEGSKLPAKAAVLFSGPQAPNHISFLAEGTNDAMITLLSPLLPVARGLGIPVLDFDKYAVARDSARTAEVVVPLVAAHLRQAIGTTPRGEQG